MKKFIVSSIVIVAFVAYSIYQRAFGSQTIPVITPKNIIDTPTPVSQNSPSFTPAPTFVPTSTPFPSQVNQPQKQPTNTPTPQNTPTPTQKPNSAYKDGTYTGDGADAFYGIIQVQATIANGRLSEVKFLQYPNDRGTSIAINSQADPMLAQEAIQTQTAQVNIVSGATDSSNAFIQSLQSALNKAKN